MAGFGSIAGDTGEPLWRSLVLMAGLWSMPGQVAFVELSAEGVTGWTLVLAVTIANLRMLPLTLASIPPLREKTGFALRQFWLAQINSVTSFVQLTDAASRITDRRNLGRYFEAFCLGTLVLGALGTAIGHTVAIRLPEQGVRTLIFVTPLYLLLLTGRTRNAMMLTAAILGCFCVPVAHLWSPDWGVVFGGVVAGTIAFVAIERRRKE
jgi:predicted branched-subunit amino acid permease